MSFSPKSLDEFNAAEADQVTALLDGLFGSPELAATVASQRPFASIDELANTAKSEFEAMSDELVLKSVHAHPPIGATVTAGSLSEKEQQAATTSAERDKAAAMDKIRELNPKYEEIHGHVFLIRASGLTSAEILEKMEERMTNDRDTEWAITREQLAGINDLRLRGLFGN
ncbi:2-oxo-4-hydroxy-4-carboxy-5-ureidoimidazoline decarboxylase [Corynebacterium urogenitale]